MIHPAREGRTILVANDHEWTARSLESILSAEGYTVVRAFTASQAVERATATPPDALILDVQLPDRDGMALCQTLRELPAVGRAVPVFLTTAGPSGRQERLAGYRAGAWEFFGQPLDGEALLLKLAVYLEAKAVVDGLRAESLLDPDTGLYSRHGLARRGQELASDAARRRQPFACVALRPALPDLEAAAAEAEDLARRVGSLLRASGRSADAIGRTGTLEFAVIMAGTPAADVEHLVSRLNRAAETASLTGAPGPAGPLFRAAVCAVDDAAAVAVDPADLLHRASDAVRSPDGGMVVVAPRG
jgi:PleD family two-component response regulator